jgi:hypothetical protein
VSYVLPAKRPHYGVKRLLKLSVRNRRSGWPLLPVPLKRLLKHELFVKRKCVRVGLLRGEGGVLGLVKEIAVVVVAVSAMSAETVVVVGERRSQGTMGERNDETAC